MSISHKFILAIFSMVFFIVGLFTYNSIKEQKKILNLQLEKRVKLMKDNLTQEATYTMAHYKNEIENDLASMNLSHIQILFIQLVKRENIDGISLSNNLQTVEIFEGMSYKKDVETLTIEETSTNFIVSSPIELSSKWGSLNIVYSLKGLNDEIDSAHQEIEKFVDQRIKDAFFSALLFAIFFGVLSYILAIKITTPILLLTQRADQIANGKLEDSKEIFRIKSNDEVGLLAKSFMQMSQKLQKSYTELKALNKTLEKKVQLRTYELSEANQKLEALLEEFKNFTANTIHQNRTPINVMKIAIEMINTKDKDALLQIESSILSMEHAYDTLEYTLNQDNINFQKEIIDLTELIKERIKVFQIIALAHDTEIKYHVEPNILISMSKIEAEFLIDNNLSNALKYSTPRKEIYVNTLKSDSKVLLTFDSAGEKIKDGSIIFKRYKRADKTKKGSGIGLNIVADICKKNHIDINLEYVNGYNRFSYTISMLKEEEIFKL